MELRVLPRSSPPLGLSLRKRSSYKPATPSPNALLYSPANLPRHPKMDALGQSNSGSHPPSAFAGSRNCPPRGAGQSEIAEEKFLPPTREKPACSCLDTSPAASHHSNRVLMKILCFTPLPYGDGSGWWGRDLGLTVRAFRQLGHDAQLVCYPTTHSKDPFDRPVQLITQSQARSKDWWIQQSPDLILLGLWTQSKYNPIRTAALSSNALVIERCDGDGFRLPSCGHRQFWKNTISAQIDAHPHCPIALAAILGGGKAGLFEIFASYFESRLAATLAMVPLFLSETPLSTRSLQSLATRIKSNPSRFQHVPHPIDENVFSYAGELKKNTVIAVGRWGSWQKDWPLTRRAWKSFWIVIQIMRPFFSAVACPWTELVKGFFLAAFARRRRYPRVSERPKSCSLLPATKAFCWQVARPFARAAR